MEESMISTAKKVFLTEIEAIKKTYQVLDNTFCCFVDEIVSCKGKIIFTGIGKSGYIAQKNAATMSSLGKASIFLHPAEAMHGDLGVIEEDDIVIALSYSGESDEVIKILPGIHRRGATLLAITGNESSTLAANSKVVQRIPLIEEACILQLAPTSSTTVMLVYGDALAVAVCERLNVKKENFAVIHPAGSLGKKLLYHTRDIMTSISYNQSIYENSTIKDAIVAMLYTGGGIIGVVNEKRSFVGIVTDGKINSAIADGADIYKDSVKNLINYNAIYIDYDSMAIEALTVMENSNICSMPIIRDNKVVGMIKKEDITNIGICL